MWGQTIFPGNPPFKSHVYICCIIFILYYSFFSTSCIVRKSHSFFSQKEGPLFTMQNGWNNRISDGCVYTQKRRGLGMHLVTYSNHDTVLSLLIVPIKGRFV